MIDDFILFFLRVHLAWMNHKSWQIWIFVFYYPSFPRENREKGEKKVQKKNITIDKTRVF